ncbi:MAG TPA: thioredoxin family protein [Sedimentisphaerales bacterium]|nr:thioredoxin family protein [Sedimentisphaerales bacterium]
MINFERLADKFDEEQKRENNSKKQRQAVKKTRKSSSHVLLLVFAVVIVASIAYYFWPTVKGIGVTTKVAALFHKDVSLTGIFYSDDDPIAIVEGKIVHEEDVVGDVKVLKIHKDEVEFERSGRRWSQNMHVAEKGASSSALVLLQLGSRKCPPCRQMTPILDELRAKYAGKFQIKYIDVWQDTAAGSEYGVRKIPTQIFYDRNGKEVFRHVGFYSKKDILGTWIKLGVNL